MKLLIFLLCMLITNAPVIALGSMPNDAWRDELVQLEENYQFVANLLYERGHIVTELMNYQAEGTLSGSFSGGGKVGSNFNLGGAALGSIASALVAGAIGSQLALPVGLGSIMMGSGALGGIAGSQAKKNLGSASLSGQIEGRYHAKGWDNLLEAQIYIVFVVDPKLVTDIEHAYANGKKTKATENTLKVVSKIIESGRYVTPQELNEFSSRLDAVKKNLITLRSRLITRDPDNNNYAVQRMSQVEAELKKTHVSINSVARHDLHLARQAGEVIEVKVVRDLGLSDDHRHETNHKIGLFGPAGNEIEMSEETITKYLEIIRVAYKSKRKALAAYGSDKPIDWANGVTGHVCEVTGKSCTWSERDWDDQLYVHKHSDPNKKPEIRLRKSGIIQNRKIELYQNPIPTVYYSLYVGGTSYASSKEILINSSKEYNGFLISMTKKGIDALSSDAIDGAEISDASANQWELVKDLETDKMIGELVTDKKTNSLLR